MPRIVFITGGVVSSLGKGIAASILAGLLKSRGLRVKAKKLDPYLNLDPGTLSPYEHGEVYVTEDGAETDLDLGHYERLGGVKSRKSDYVTAGSIYNNILKKERRGDYLGKTVMVIPHVTQEIQKAILKKTSDCDVLICEIGGTVGDIESFPFLEAARQMRQKYGKKVLFMHVALLPYLEKSEEWKTKPIQHSVHTLLQSGIQPDMILCRMRERSKSDWQEKVALHCNLKKDKVLAATDAKSIYHAFLNYSQEGVDEEVLKIFKIKLPPADLNALKNFVSKLDADFEEIKVAIIGKYVGYKDSYKSLEESLIHAAIQIERKLQIKWIDSQDFSPDQVSDCNCILVPGGFGDRGIDGMIRAVRYAREKDIPFLGICLGFQVSVIEGLRETLEDANSSEFGLCKNPVIAKMEEWSDGKIKIKAKKMLGGSMRLGLYPCEIKPGTLAYEVYKKENIHERHRHRYEVNNKYIDFFDKVGLTISGKCGELVEIVERKKNKFFISVQFHPEFNSTMNSPNPIFVAFLKAGAAK